MIYPNYHSKHHANIPQSSEQEESSCSQCKRNTYGIREQSEQDESSLQIPQRNNNTESSSEDEASVPFRKQIAERNYQFEEMLKLLQQQVNTLKQQNQTKDLMIRQLKFQMHKSAVEEERKLQSNKQAYEINRLRQQLGCSPRNNFRNAGNSFKSASFQKKSRLAQGYEQNHYFRGLNQNVAQDIYANQRIYGNQQFMQKLKPNHSQLPKQHQKTQYELKITILEKQIREYQLELLQQKQRLTHLEEQTKWQQKFVQSFIKMCEQLSLNYGEKLKLNKLGDDLKKKTKICWHYMKNLIGFFIQNNSLDESSAQTS